MEEIQQNDNLTAEAEDISAQATQFLAQSMHERLKTLEEILPNSATPSDQLPPLATDKKVKQLKHAPPRKIRDPLLLAKLGQELSMPRLDLNEKNNEGSSLEDDGSFGEGVGGIPPKSTDGPKNPVNNQAAPAVRSQKKNSRKIFKRPRPPKPPTPKDILLRNRLLAGTRDAKIRQLFEMMLTNPNITMPQAMKVIGYSENTPPQHIVRTKSWQLMVDTIVSPEEIKERERFLLFHEDPKWTNASLDRLHKIKGSFQHTQTNVNINVEGEIRQMSDQKLYELIEEDEDVIEGELTSAAGSPYNDPT